ncbi:YdcF family protein [Paenibacillus sp. CMAA1364]
MIRNHSRIKMVLKRTIVAIVMIFLFVLMWLGYVLWKINTVESTSDSQPVDVGIILGSSMWGDTPSPSLKERLDHGLKEYKKGKFKTFIVSGGLDKPEFNFTEAEGMRQYLLEHGVLDPFIVMENEATSTLENLKFSQYIMEQRGWTTALIITHTYHGMRSLDIAEYLDFQSPILSTTDSNVLSMPYHKSREILAYSKWKLDEFLLRLGLKSVESVNNHS